MECGRGLRQGSRGVLPGVPGLVERHQWSFPDPSAAPGSRVLLRYLDAGTVHHTMALLGTHQRAIAKDAYPVRYPYDVVAETIPVGSTLDTIVTVPTGAAAGTRFWLYNRQLHLDNAGAFPGGMVTYIEVSGP